MAVSVVTGPAEDAVSVGEAKDHAKVENADDDALIAAQITAATRLVEKWTGRTLVEQTLKLSLDRFPAARSEQWWDGVRQGARSELDTINFIELPRPPLKSVQSLETFDDADAATVFAASRYFVDTANAPGRLVLRTAETWPVFTRAANGVEITYIAGYGKASEVPRELRQGMLLLVAHWYENRETVVVGDTVEDVPLSVATILHFYRVLRIG